jgi:DNA polymerase-3 subunit delta'
MYIIDCSKLTVKNENVILKFLEEPLKNSFIILKAESRYSIIPTVLNRCQVWEFESYPQEYLDSLISTYGFGDKNIVTEVANTPGKINEYKDHPISEMIALANKVFNSMPVANFANALTIGRFIAFKNEKDKYDFNLFLSILLVISKRLVMNGHPRGYEVYDLTRKLNNNKYLFSADKKSLFDNYIIELKLLVGDMR